MSKPMKDWTLGELKDTCDEHRSCQGCPMHIGSDGDYTCKASKTVKSKDVPSWWDLDEQEKKDVTIMEKLLCALSGAKYLSRNEGSEKVNMWDGRPEKCECDGLTFYAVSETGNEVGLLPAALFPSVADGELLEVSGE